jgi:ring-1,2-phenylacetyl-CoA epoxidase subunit PaaD
VVSAAAAVLAVLDPELPLLTIGDLGIVRDVTVDGDHAVATITPTYSGCPAIAEIAGGVRHALESAGYVAEVRTRLAPPWSTDWITAEGRRKLTAAGIAPPGPATVHAGPIPLQLGPPRVVVPCPRCGSDDTDRTADFGATACKALYRCGSCDEPFEAVKAL